jgi:hypothetical protein
MNSKRISTNSQTLKGNYKKKREREMNEIKKTVQDMKEKLNKDMESFQKNKKKQKNKKTKKTKNKKTQLNRNPGNKNFLSQIKNTVESHSSRLGQVENRISVFKDKIDIKEKNKRILRQKFLELQKEYARTRDSIKRPNLQMINTEEGEEMQAKV